MVLNAKIIWKILACTMVVPVQRMNFAGTNSPSAVLNVITRCNTTTHSWDGQIFWVRRRPKAFCTHEIKNVWEVGPVLKMGDLILFDLPFFRDLQIMSFIYPYILDFTEMLYLSVFENIKIWYKIILIYYWTRLDLSKWWIKCVIAFEARSFFRKMKPATSVDKRMEVKMLLRSI